MDKLIDRPLHKMPRRDAVLALQQARQELIDARQKIRDLEGQVQTLIECDNYQPTHVINKTKL